jgi:hypothetical protein
MYGAPNEKLEDINSKSRKVRINGLFSDYQQDTQFYMNVEWQLIHKVI